MNLADDLKSVDEANKILDKYEGHQKDKNHKSVMNAIVNANKKIFQEAKKMCEALLELMKDELDALILLSFLHRRTYGLLGK